MTLLTSKLAKSDIFYSLSKIVILKIKFLAFVLIKETDCLYVLFFMDVTVFVQKTNDMNLGLYYSILY